MKLEEENLHEAEDEIRQRILEVFFDLSESESIEITSIEFGEIANSLIKEQAEEEVEQRNKISITSPEGIDCSEKKVVFFLGVDDRDIPRAYTEPWPRFVNDIDKHQETERYLFLAVIRAASEKLHLSFSRVKNEDVCRPSIYLEECCSFLDMPEPTQMQLRSRPRKALPAPVSGTGKRRRRRKYTLDEIAHYGLCPLRYKLERFDRSSQNYKSIWQLQFLAESIWFEKCLAYICNAKLRLTGEDQIYAALSDALAKTEARIKGIFPGFRDIDWISIKQSMIKIIRERANFWVDKSYVVSIEDAPKIDYIITERDRKVQVDASLQFVLKRGAYKFPFITRDLLVREWLIPAVQEGDGNPWCEVDGVRAFASRYHAIKWWREALSTAFYHKVGSNKPDETKKRYQTIEGEIREVIEQLESQIYPKNPGPHCSYCPIIVVTVL
jgi:hypothetical protein